MKNKNLLPFLTLLLYIIMANLPGAFAQTDKPSVYAIEHVNVITMDASHRVYENAIVVVANHRILSINGPVPKNATLINAKGKWLMPGLIDAHVHLPTDAYFGPKLPTQMPDLAFDLQDIMTPIVLYGVTTVLDLNATMETFAQKKAIEKGYIIGPRIAMAALINGGSGPGRIANTAEEGRIAVRQAKAEGYDCIKLYSKLNMETFHAIVAEAHLQGLKTVGHIPNAFKDSLSQAFVPHFGMVAHAEEFSKHSKEFSEADAVKFANMSKDNDTWLSPTLTTMVWIAKQTHSIDHIKNHQALPLVHPLLQSKWLTANNYVKNASPEIAAYFDNMVQFHFRLVKAFKAAGVPIVAGTDAGVSGVIAGYSIHDELALLVQAGLTAQEALEAATMVAAKWLGIDKTIGSIEAGKFADLILLDKNPLADISNTRSIAGVFVNGIWLDKPTITTMLTNLANRNTANKAQFDWKTFMSGKK
jgi:imidazolonepropionase-like amidohydrolase